MCVGCVSCESGLSGCSALPPVSSTDPALRHGQAAPHGLADPASRDTYLLSQQRDWHVEELKPWRREEAGAWHCISYKHGCLLFLQIIGYRPGAGVPVSVDCKVQVLLSFVLGSVVCRSSNLSL